MAFKAFEIADVGTVHVYKRRGSKNIRLSVNSDGKIRATIPSWLPYKAGYSFALQKQSWLAEQKPSLDFRDNQRLGKFHTLHFVPKPDQSKITTRVTDTEAFVNYPYNASKTELASAAHAVAKRVMKLEAEKLLPQRLSQLAQKLDFGYNSVSIRHLKSRWGSCSSKADVVLNYYLMQLPWELIDYVIIHELVHTQHLNHSKEFWSTVEQHLPDYKRRRKAMHDFQPSILSPKSMRSMA